MANVTPPEPQSAADYDDRTTAAVPKPWATANTPRWSKPSWSTDTSSELDFDVSSLRARCRLRTAVIRSIFS